MKKLVLKKKYKKHLLNILLILLSFLFIYETYKSIKIYYYETKSKKINEELVKDVVTTDKNKQTTIDFEKLKEKNIDIIGWIKIPNTHINYPIMQTFDNNYYLNRDFNNNYNIFGSIYMDYKNKYDFSDPNTIIYGHYTHTQDMFSDLKKVYEEELKSPLNIYIYTSNKDYTYTAYSMYLTNPNDEESINLSTSYFTKSDKDFNINLENEKIKHTLTLVTCYNDSNRRIILHAYLNQDNLED